jgi:hypothetical protein
MILNDRWFLLTDNDSAQGPAGLDDACPRASA